MFEADLQRLDDARLAAVVDGSVQVWTVLNIEELAVQAVALMAHAGVRLPPGQLEDLTAFRAPRKTIFGVPTEFHAWSNAELRARLAVGAPANVGEIRLGDNVQPMLILADFPGLDDNSVRRFQLRAIIHELFHALDCLAAVSVCGGDRDSAICLEQQFIGFGSNLPGYARNEIVTDSRTRVVLDTNGLLYPELRLAFDDYRLIWESHGAMSEVAFDVVQQTLGRTVYP